MEFDRHTFYIVCSYGMLALAMVIEIIALRVRRRQALRVVAAQGDSADSESNMAPQARRKHEIPA